MADAARIERGPPRGPRFWQQRWFVYSGLAALATAAIVPLLVVLIPGSKPEPVADPRWLGTPAAGDVVYCSGEDVSRSQQRSVRDFNRSSDRGTATAILDDDISPNANDQREAYLKLIQSGKCDVVYLDVIYNPEFASRDILYDMSDYLLSLIHI